MTGAPSSVLILRFSAVGDVILTAPALHALKTAWPKTRIIYGVKGRLGHLVENNPNVDEVVALQPGEGILSYSRRLRATKPEAVLDLHGKLRSRMLRLLLPGAPSTVWTNRDYRQTLPVKLGLRPYHSKMYVADRYHAAVEKLVGQSLPKGELRYWLGPDDLKLADKELLSAGVDLTRPILGLSPGANWATKRWPVERYGVLAQRAIAQGVQVVVAGSADEAALAQRVKELAPGAVDVSGKLDLKGLGGFISRCTAFVANDSGPMHMARALCVPTLAFFGSTDPNMFKFEGHARLFAGVECSPCSFFGRKECPKGHFRCMLDLSEELAWQTLAPLLRSGRVAPLSG